MKKLTIFLLISILCVACNTKTDEKSNPKIEEQKIEREPTNNDLQEIEKNGRSFYDWYFKNDFPNSDIIKSKNGKCTFDTIIYFKTLRKIGTISEKFIKKEKERLQGCEDFISTINFSDYVNADAYDYVEYCEDIYYMYWIKSQEPPNNFSTKNIEKINENQATLDIYVNYGGKDEPLSRVILEKEQNVWKIIEIKFLNRDEAQKEKVSVSSGKWQNSLVTLNIGKESLALEYHGQCVYFYPIKKISENEFEMIWARDMDCKFDNGTDKTFGLKNVPTIGRPFAKYTLKNNILYAEYYYKEWVKKYTEQVQEDVFTDKYFRKNEAILDE